MGGGLAGVRQCGAERWVVGDRLASDRQPLDGAAIEPGWGVPAAGNPRSVERGEHLVRIAVRLADLVGSDCVGRSGSDQRHLAECGGDALVALRAVRGEVGGDVDGGRTGLGDHRSDHVFRTSPPDA